MVNCKKYFEEMIDQTDLNLQKLLHIDHAHKA